jgi:hypothetical protein
MDFELPVVMKWKISGWSWHSLFGVQQEKIHSLQLFSNSPIRDEL